LDQPDIRRLPDGAIDYDYYRRSARAHRAAAIRDFLALIRPSGLLARLRAAWNL